MIISTWNPICLRGTRNWSTFITFHHDHNTFCQHQQIGSKVGNLWPRLDHLMVCCDNPVERAGISLQEKKTCTKMGASATANCGCKKENSQNTRCAARETGVPLLLMDISWRVVYLKLWKAWVRPPCAEQLTPRATQLFFPGSAPSHWWICAPNIRWHIMA